MKYSEAKLGRVFVLRLEDGDVIHEILEKFAREKCIKAASVTILGGADVDSCLVVGPEQGRATPIKPQTRILDKVHEVTGTGTLFPGEDGNPSLHLHLSCGNGDQVLTGCVRNGVRVWHIMEVVVQELTECTAVRRLDPVTGFELLNP